MNQSPSKPSSAKQPSPTHSSTATPHCANASSSCASDTTLEFSGLLHPATTTSFTRITAVRSTDLPHLQAFTRGLDCDKDAVRAALTLPFHNGGTEGANTKTKRIMRQMHGRAGFSLLHHRILLG